MSKVLTIGSAKGGTGKTTSAVNLSAELAAAGNAVVLVDLDPQASATLSLGRRPATDPWKQPPTIVQLGERGPSMALCRGSRALGGAGIPDIHRLISAYANESGVDVVVVDTPPTLGPITVGALEAADVVLVPLEPTPLALPGLTDLKVVLEQVAGGAQLRSVLVRVQARRLLSGDIRSHITTAHPGALYRNLIPEDVRAAEAPSHGEPLLVYAPSSRAGEAYNRLAGEVAKDLGARQPARRDEESHA